MRSSVVVAFAAASLFALALSRVAAPLAAQVEPESVEGSAIHFVHGEKSPPGTHLNGDLGLPDALDPASLIQIGDDVYFDSNRDGNAELIVANAHFDGAGHIIAGLAPGATSADESVFRAEERDLIVAGLRGLAAQFDSGRLSDPDYRIAQSRWLAGLQADTFGVTGGLSFLLELWDEGLISPLCYGIKRHEMLDAL